ncbi:hypothetical protein VPMS16_2967 [Vibrio sp. 16]|nr:hypothetical protein VPMS16_2967 [Vibrio sp. 16]
MAFWQTLPAMLYFAELFYHHPQREPRGSSRYKVPVSSLQFELKQTL